MRICSEACPGFILGGQKKCLEGGAELCLPEEQKKNSAPPKIFSAPPPAEFDLPPG